MRRRLGVLMVAGSILAAAAFGPSTGPLATTAAEAHNPWPAQGCGSTHLCVWRDADYNGPGYSTAASLPDWEAPCGRLCGVEDEDSSSANNGTTYRVKIHKDINYQNTIIVCLPRGWASGHHSPNDAGSSNLWVAASGCAAKQ